MRGSGIRVNLSPKFAMSPLWGWNLETLDFQVTRKARSPFGGILTLQEGNYGHSMVPFLNIWMMTYLRTESSLEGF